MVCVPIGKSAPENKPSVWFRYIFSLILQVVLTKASSQKTCTAFCPIGANIKISSGQIIVKFPVGIKAETVTIKEQKASSAHSSITL